MLNPLIYGTTHTTKASLELQNATTKLAHAILIVFALTTDGEALFFDFSWGRCRVLQKARSCVK
jgi:hypothetical protein|tara:strand:- start:391 stop:582 length:192 start_codon:yes stop_codon:yes gene_type:complete